MDQTNDPCWYHKLVHARCILFLTNTSNHGEPFERPFWLFRVFLSLPLRNCHPEASTLVLACPHLSRAGERVGTKSVGRAVHLGDTGTNGQQGRPRRTPVECGRAWDLLRKNSSSITVVFEPPGLTPWFPGETSGWRVRRGL